MLASANWSTSMWLARSSSACARRLTVSLVIATDSGGCSATLAASAIAASNAWPGSATSSTRPHWCASSALMRWSARITACLVRAGPIRCSMRGMLCQLIFMPSPISGTRKCASRPITRKSRATASATPPPTQKPSMAAIVICSISCQAWVRRGPSLRCRRSVPRSMSLRERPSASLRSKPALNAPALPVSTTTEVAESSSKLRAAAVSWRSASGDNALMPSPRSNRTTAIRPSGPRPFSILTKSVNAISQFLLFLPLEMTGAAMLGLRLGDRKSVRGTDGDPVGVFAGDVAAVDHVDGKDLVRPVAHAGLEARLHLARDLGGAGLPVRLDRPLEGVGEFPVEADAVGQVMAIHRAIPEPAAIDVDAHGLRQAEGRGDDDKGG